MRKCFLVLLLIGCPSLAVACLWDHDTLRMERQQFPSALELITGKFLRHSPEFYTWRVQDRLKRLEKDPQNLALLDDLGVAYDKLGQQDKAIEIAIRAEAIKPGRYETLANRGTFELHAGRYCEGLFFIDAALIVNPAAHFNREKYQKYIAELLESHSQPKLTLPLATVTSTQLEPANGQGIDVKYPDWKHHDREAVKGILGIMKFGNHKSPLILELLGYSLKDRYGSQADPKQLIARAFLKASYEVPEGDSRTKYRWLAQHALEMQVSPTTGQMGTPLKDVEEEFQKELRDADQWYEEVRADEIRWIAEGKNPEEEFDRKYYTEPEAAHVQVVPTTILKGSDRLIGAVVCVLVFVLSGLGLSVYIVYRIFFKRR
ncbi:MAG: tetratricopeptide repeat protein [Fimbriiglobus sp.]